MRADPRVALLCAALGACGTRGALERACLQNDGSASPSQCYAAAYDEGWADGAHTGWNEGYDDGYATCVPSESGETGDSGGDSG